MWEPLSQRLEEGIRQIYLFLPRLLAAIGILMAGFAIAKMVERATDIALHRIGFDRWMNEGGVTEALERAGTRLDPSTVLAKLLRHLTPLVARRERWGQSNTGARARRAACIVRFSLRGLTA